jgi:uncharacterized membrane protein YdjX (TVP38/TMEM64 family)
MSAEPELTAPALDAEGPASARRRRRLVRFVPLIILFGLTAAVFGLGLDRYATLEAVREHYAGLTMFIERVPGLAALIYLALYTALTALSLPWASLLTIAGGLLFGPAIGSVLTVAAATAGAVIVHGIAGSALGVPLRARMRRWLAPGRLERIEAGMRANAFSYVLALRLAPIFPFVVVNLAAALIGVPVRPYALATALGIIPGTLVYALFGSALGDVITRVDGADLSTALPPSLIAAFFGMAVLAIIPVIVKRRLRR